MAYNGSLADRVRQALIGVGMIQEKRMFGSLGFMVNGKLTVCVRESNIMYKLAPEHCREAVHSGVAEPVVMRNRTMKNWVCVSDDRLAKDNNFDTWLAAAIAFNKSNQG